MRLVQSTQGDVSSLQSNLCDCLTCPARLNRIEKILYARVRNAPSEKFTTARSMLARYW